MGQWPWSLVIFCSMDQLWFPVLNLGVSGQKFVFLCPSIFAFSSAVIQITISTTPIACTVEKRVFRDVKRLRCRCPALKFPPNLPPPLAWEVSVLDSKIYVFPIQQERKEVHFRMFWGIKWQYKLHRVAILQKLQEDYASPRVQGKISLSSST